MAGNVIISQNNIYGVDGISMRKSSSPTSVHSKAVKLNKLITSM